MKLAVFAALMAIALPGPAVASDWVLRHNSANGDKDYIDGQSIRTTPNGYRGAWMRSDLEKADNDGNTNHLAYVEFDCIKKRARNLSNVGRKGEHVTGTINKVGGWIYIETGTLFERDLKFVCRK